MVSEMQPAGLSPGLTSHLSGGGELDYFAYIPERATPSSPVLVSVHGLERQALQHAVRFSPLAERFGFIVVAPLFTKSRMSRYQRAQPAREAAEAPLDAFDLTVDHFRRAHDLQTSAIDLFGYSGGAQFAMRYVLAGSILVRRLVLAAPGWFTMPSDAYPYPYGVGAIGAKAPRPLQLERLLTTPTLLVVGSEDTRREASLNREPLIDEMQGRNRLERARRWSEAMAVAAKARGLTGQVELRILPEAGHDFDDNMRTHALGQHVFDWISGQG